MVTGATAGRTGAGRAWPALRWIGGAVALGLLLAALGPFGSYLNDDLAGRAAYWIAAMLLGLLLYGAAYRLVTATLPAGSRAWWPALIGAALVASVPEALATRGVALRLWPELARVDPAWPLWLGQTATLGLLVTIAAALLLRRAGAMAAGVATPAPVVAAERLAGDVLALQMEDHYVRVHRPHGSELVLMPLGRAIDSVAAPGLRTHRSWWVAAHAVVRVEGNARSMQLHLSNGAVAPVARSAVIHLKAAGWIGG